MWNCGDTGLKLEFTTRYILYCLPIERPQMTWPGLRPDPKEKKPRLALTNGAMDSAKSEIHPAAVIINFIENPCFIGVSSVAESLVAAVDRTESSVPAWFKTFGSGPSLIFQI